MTNNNVTAIYNVIVKQDLLEDRREYDVAELQHSYALTEADATLLYNMIQENFAPTDNRLTLALKDIVALDGMRVKRGLLEYVEESSNNGWEGYTMVQTLAVQEFIIDFALTLSNNSVTGTSKYFDTKYGIKID